jgi:hypothetical protein
MDGDRFDDLIKRLGMSRFTRLSALRGLAGAVAALGGAALSDDDADAVKRRNNRKRRRNRGKTRRICHCDANGQDCRTLRLSKKKAKRHLKRHPNDSSGRCDDDTCLDTDTECNPNRPGRCCARTCCVDTTSNSGGICPLDGSNCCGQHHTGGYCAPPFSQCCAQDACCRTNEVCCANAFDPTGYCCPAGSVCDANQPNGCSALPGGTTLESVSDSPDPGRIRSRFGN